MRFYVVKNDEGEYLNKSNGWSKHFAKVFCHGGTLKNSNVQKWILQGEKLRVIELYEGKEVNIDFYTQKFIDKQEKKELTKKKVNYYNYLLEEHDRIGREIYKYKNNE